MRLLSTESLFDRASEYCLSADELKRFCEALRLVSHEKIDIDELSKVVEEYSLSETGFWTFLCCIDMYKLYYTRDEYLKKKMREVFKSEDELTRFCKIVDEEPAVSSNIVEGIKESLKGLLEDKNK